ncbi:MAG: CocE/NonD family hydrolase [Armatimonadetes bacterium]|nr:CocE/NonD family hydrolase [Armatimonadota bacterium]
MRLRRLCWWVTVLAAAAGAQNAPRQQTVMVPMRDGVKLATEVFLPQGDGPWPVILARTPYSRKAGQGIAAGLNLAGYAVVAQDVRGRFDSEGENKPFMFDGWGKQQDGYDACQWIVAQTWCNGMIGTWGGSALGITQVLTAGANPPGVAAQHISVCTGSLYHHAAYIGGAYCQALVDGWVAGNKFDAEALELMRTHTTYDDYWRGLDSSTRVEGINLPAIFLGGWYDVFTQGTIDAFQWRQERGAPGARGQQKLIMGPWGHGITPKIGDLSYPNSGKAPGPLNELAWFGYWLKGQDTGVKDAPAVTYYLMGDPTDPTSPGNVWKTSDVWPPKHTPTALFLHRDGALSATAPAAGDEPLRYTYAPANPVPTRGGNNLNLPAGPRDQRDVEGRPDVLTFTGAPLTDPLTITGPILAKLWVASSAVDTDFTVKLTDVYPDGRSMLVIDGIRRMKHRNTFEQDELLTPGEVYPITVDCWSTALVFSTGHRIRIDVSSSNSPKWQPNPNTGKPFGDLEKVKADNTVYLYGARPSHVVLPVVTE